MVVFELRQAEPFELAPREDCHVVRITSLGELKRYSRGWLEGFVSRRTLQKWGLSILLRRGYLFFGLDAGRCVNYTYSAPARQAAFGRLLDPDAHGIGPMATAESHRGRGLSPHVMRWAINYLIEHRQIAHFYIATRPENQASMRALGKVGFLEVGTCEYEYRLHPKLCHIARWI